MDQNKHNCGQNGCVINGICCNAVNCVHNDDHNCCTAGHVDIGIHDAQDTNETRCKTFECKC